MRTPQALKPGDEIRLIAPSRWVEESMVIAAEEAIRAQGFLPTRGANLLARNGQLAGTDNQRADDLTNAWNHEHVKAIWALRGGYGAQRVLATFERAMRSTMLKWFVGFSDSTAIHGMLNNLDFVSLHAPMWSTFPTTIEQHVESTFSILRGEAEDVPFDASTHDVCGVASGRIVGGNLSVLQTMIGTSSFPIRPGDILLIEDLDEMLYHVDRMMLHLVRSGELAKLSGILIGGMSDMRDNTKAYGFSSDNPFGMGVNEILSEHLSKLGIPIGFNFPAGHGQKNQPVILGAQATLEVTPMGNRLTYDCP